MNDEIVTCLVEITMNRASRRWRPILTNTITAEHGNHPGHGDYQPVVWIAVIGVGCCHRAAVLFCPWGRGDVAVWYSIQANFISLLIGYPIVLLVALLSGIVGEWIFVLWPFAAVAISTYIERG